MKKANNLIYDESDIVENLIFIGRKGRSFLSFFLLLYPYFLIDVMEKIQFILDLAETIDNDPLFDAEKEYTGLINLPITIDSDFFELVYLVTDANWGLVLEDKRYPTNIKENFKSFFGKMHEDLFFHITVDSDKDRFGQAEDLGKLLFEFYIYSGTGKQFFNKYFEILVEEVLYGLSIWSTKEEVCNILGERLLNKLKKYDII